MRNTFKEPLPLFNPNFDPYDRIRELEIHQGQLAENQERLSEQLANQGWLIEEASKFINQLVEALNKNHSRVQQQELRIKKLELQNEKNTRNLR
jgi:vacuolar-type H+-ATPase subunit I/STV1